MLEIARNYPSPRAPLRPQSMYTMLLLAYCAGLRRGELARLDLGDVDLHEGTITIRQTKFFKTRILPLPDSVVVALRAYIDARRCAGGSQDRSAEHTSELQVTNAHLVCRLLLEKKKKII